MTPLVRTPDVDAGCRVKVAVVGHVDHGKSTLVGRLLHDTHAVYRSRVQDARVGCRADNGQVEYAFLMDAFEEERSGGLTLDVSTARFDAGGRSYLVVDAPGHKEFLKHAASGAAGADTAVLVIDAAEGVCEQTRRHALLLPLLGVRSLIVAVNKMDRVHYARDAFIGIRSAFEAELGALSLHPAGVIPVSACAGDNVVRRSERMVWYEGPTLLQALSASGSMRTYREQPLRLPLQDACFVGGERLWVGRVESGQVRRGDSVLAMPSGRVHRIRAIRKWNEPDPECASAGESVGLELEKGGQASRGDVLCDRARPARRAKRFTAGIFWLGASPMRLDRSYAVRLTTQERNVRLLEVKRLIRAQNLEEITSGLSEVPQGDWAEASMESDTDFACDAFGAVEPLGRLAFFDGPVLAGGGILLEAA